MDGSENLRAFKFRIQNKTEEMFKLIILSIFIFFTFQSTTTDDFFKDENIIKFREFISIEKEKGNQNKKFTFDDEGNGFKSKIYENEINETIKKDRILKLKGNYFVYGTKSKYLNVYQCVDLCSEGYELISIFEKEIKIVKYDIKNGIPIEIKKIPIIGKCFCKLFEKKISKNIEEEFESPFGIFKFKLNANHENKNKIEFSSFQNQNNGKYFGNSNFDQNGKNKIEISANFKPKLNLSEEDEDKKYFKKKNNYSIN